MNKFTLPQKFTNFKFDCPNDTLPLIFFKPPFNLGTFKEFGEYSLEEQEIMQELLMAHEVDT